MPGSLNRESSGLDMPGDYHISSSSSVPTGWSSNPWMLSSFYTTGVNINVQFAAAKANELQDSTRPMARFDTLKPHTTIDDNNTDTASDSRVSSIRSSPAQPSPLSSMPNTPPLLDLSLQNQDSLAPEQDLAGFKDDLVYIHSPGLTLSNKLITNDPDDSTDVILIPTLPASVRMAVSHHPLAARDRDQPHLAPSMNNPTS